MLPPPAKLRRPGLGPRGVLPDLASLKERIAARGMTLGAPLELLAETTSTNDLAKDGARSGAPHGATFVAERQTAGRGRQGRVWLGEPGESLLFSVLLRVPCALSRLPPLALVAGLAVRDAIAKATATEPQLKWPNDVLLGQRKVAGVLVEGIVQGERATAIVVGVGINVHARVFPEAIAEVATSVALHAERPPDRAELLADVLAGLDRDVGLVAARGVGMVHARLTRADALFGRAVRSDDASSGGDRGVGGGIDADGRLIVVRADGTRAHWSSGEVHLVR